LARLLHTGSLGCVCSAQWREEMLSQLLPSSIRPGSEVAVAGCIGKAEVARKLVLTAVERFGESMCLSTTQVSSNRRRSLNTVRRISTPTSTPFCRDISGFPGSHSGNAATRWRLHRQLRLVVGHPSNWGHSIERLLSSNGRSACLNAQPSH